MNTYQFSHNDDDEYVFFLLSFARIKSIFHCDAKPFALGSGVGLHPQHENFALGIPTCCYLKMQNLP